MSLRLVPAGPNREAMVNLIVCAHVFVSGESKLCGNGLSPPQNDVRYDQSVTNTKNESIETIDCTKAALYFYGGSIWILVFRFVVQSRNELSSYTISYTPV